MTTDTLRLAQIHAACFDHPRPWSPAEFDSLLSGNGAHLVAKPNGFALARMVMDEAEILTIAVVPGARQRGLGRKILDQLELELAGAGICLMHLEVSETNTAALALYYSNGYRESGRRSGYYSDSVHPRQDALVLSKTISA